MHQGYQRDIIHSILHPIIFMIMLRTLTKPVSFEDCIKAIKEHAFASSDFPVIITLEDHLPASLQAVAALVNRIVEFN